MKWLKGVTAAAVLMMVAAPAVGQDNIEFMRTNWGTYYGPYTLASIPGQNQFDAFCVDYYHHVWAGDPWKAVYTRIGDGDLRNNARYGSSWKSDGDERFENDDVGLRLQYQRSAWLASQLPDFGPGGDAQDLHHFIWGLWGDNPTGAWSGALGLLKESEDSFQRTNFDDWYVVTDVTGERQEFITPHVNVVPEPATVILMGTGLLAVMGMTIVMRRSVG